MAGCTPVRHEPPPPPPQFLDHTVSYAGETLGIIAKWYTGDTNNAKGILTANPGLDPKKITIGKVIHVPREMVTKSEPLPKSALAIKKIGNNSFKKRKGLKGAVHHDEVISEEGEPLPPARGVSDVVPAPTSSPLLANQPETVPVEKKAHFLDRVLPDNAPLEVKPTLDAGKNPTLPPLVITPPVIGKSAHTATPSPLIENPLHDEVAAPAPTADSDAQRRRSVLEEMLDGK